MNSHVDFGLADGRGLHLVCLLVVTGFKARRRPTVLYFLDRSEPFRSERTCGVNRGGSPAAVVYSDRRMARPTPNRVSIVPVTLKPQET